MYTYLVIKPSVPAKALDAFMTASALRFFSRTDYGQTARWKLAQEPTDGNCLYCKIILSAERRKWRSSKYALYKCKDSVTTETKTSLSIRNSTSISRAKSTGSHSLALKSTSTVWLCPPYRLPLREGERVQTTCLSEVASGPR